MRNRGGPQRSTPRPNGVSKVSANAKRRAGTNAAPAATGPAELTRDIYELEIELVDIEPRIWRRIAIPASATLVALHRAIQVTMGWHDLHLHEFVAPSGRRYAATDPNVDPGVRGERVVDAHRVALGEVLREPGTSLTYEYDFGDGWRHRITLAEIRDLAAGEHFPRCLAGERSCPPEDCGGPWGYEDLLGALVDPRHERHEELRDWAGPHFDAEAFDIAAINDLLQRLL